MVKNSIVASGGFAHKISDVGQMQHGVLPFDLFGCAGNKMIVCESKFNKECVSLNLGRLEKHQIDSLIQVYESFEDKDRICALFMVGVVFGHADIRVFWWKNEELYNIRDRKKLKENILKKEFVQIPRYLKIKKNLIDFKQILENS